MKTGWDYHSVANFRPMQIEPGTELTTPTELKDNRKLGEWAWQQRSTLNR
jgi:hypothetical protein